MLYQNHFHYILQTKWTALHYAVYSGNLDMVVLLLNHGANINLQNKVRHDNRIEYDPTSYTKQICMVTSSWVGLLS